MITPQNVFRHELIGLTVEVTDSNHKQNIGIKGKIIDETRNTIVVDTGSQEKQLIKDTVVFTLYLPENKKVSVDGKYIVARPEDRIKKKFKKIR
ncbi:MAG: ribonuclease P protein component 1 [Methanosphaera sp.]|uniref:ribonuclease P protein component 1 n=1 Tax=Methanosphaera sp. TaxID=2666342 RepID=UPI0025F2CF78|nr:ribonuclease P protein component 1 [Methanosphaera sp.]MCI5866641.1 ribonuclease P protein component 1 [Methanosphaera sp.]MDD6535125.1 ribonuclease P protein component 1 [Methanosphaera sp.]MDY3955935.1 ribonuclease P protein component 1 [Methanosphaera sp.]